MWHGVSLNVWTTGYIKLEKQVENSNYNVCLLALKKKDHTGFMISYICSLSKARCSSSSITGCSHRELMLLTHRVKCIGIDISFITFQLIFSIKGTLNLICFHESPLKMMKNPF